jgi:hypothetical protein
VATGKVEASRPVSAGDEGSTVDLGLPGEERGFFCVSGEVLRHGDITTGRGRDLVRAPALDLLGGSPDGRQAAFITTDPATGATSVRVLTLATGDVTDVFSVAAPTTIFRPTFAWAPDGRSLVVQQRTQEQPFEMWFVPLDGRPAHRIDMPVQVGVGWHFSPSTDQVVFGLRATGARSEIWKMENVVPAPSAGTASVIAR